VLKPGFVAFESHFCLKSLPVSGAISTAVYGPRSGKRFKAKMATKSTEPGFRTASQREFASNVIGMIESLAYDFDWKKKRDFGLLFSRI